MAEFKQTPDFPWGNPGCQHDIVWNHPVYKYVDLAHADVVSAGSVKIGTLWGYGKLEGERRDGAENSIGIDFAMEDVLDSSRADHQILLRTMGLSAPPGIKIFMKGASVNARGKDYYSCCFSKSADAGSLATARSQAIFKIDDVNAWINRICQLTRILGPATCAEVSYRARSGSRLVGGRGYPSPFVKALAFAREEEVRIVWLTTQPSTPLPTLDLIGPDEVLAGLITRVR